MWHLAEKTLRSICEQEIERGSFAIRVVMLRASDRTAALTSCIQRSHLCLEKLEENTGQDRTFGRAGRSKRAGTRRHIHKFRRGRGILRRCSPQPDRVDCYPPLRRCMPHPASATS
eukprot:6861785-Prymnesium_polylepis.1